MIKSLEIGWLNEHLLRLSQTPEDKKIAADIVKTFRRLWVVAKAGARYRNTRTNESLESFCAALDVLTPVRGHFETAADLEARTESE